MLKNLEVKNVSKKYGDFVALKPTSLSVENGEFITILGPSGSGKTTLLNIMSGFDIPTNGSVHIGDNDITYSPPHKRGLGVMFQNYALFPHMTAFENVCFPLKMRKIPKNEMVEKANRALDLVQLLAFKDRYPEQLSGGQRQRIALARAIVFDPPVLLLDEPLGALDKQLRSQMQVEIKNIQERLKITTVSVTHDQEEALTMSTRICVLREGGVEQIGTPMDIYRNPENRFVADFIGETNLLDAKIIGWEGKTGIIETDKGEIIRAVTSNKNLSEVSYSIRPEFIKVTTEDNSLDNRLKGEIKELIYLGDSGKCSIETLKGEIINIKLGVKELQNVQKGQNIVIGWNVNDGVLLQKNTEEVNYTK